MVIEKVYFDFLFIYLGPFSNFRIAECTNNNGFLLKVDGPTLSLALGGATIHSFVVSDCTCWKHFIVSIDRSSPSAVVILYQNGVKTGSAVSSSAETIINTNFFVSPITNFRNLEIWNFVVDDSEAAEIFSKGMYMEFAYK